MRRVYLDNNATTRPDPDVVAKMLPFLGEQFGNPSSAHGFGQPVAEAVRHARRQLQGLIGARHDHEVVFTSGGTESDNWALLAGLALRPGRKEIVTTQVEHPAILSCVTYLAETWGCRVHALPVDSRGRLDLEAYEDALSERTAIVSIMWANNETGTIFPVPDLARRAHRVGALFHTDAVQALGKLALDLKETEVDMLSLSAHKIHGPKGIGALYLRKGLKPPPFVHGGHQERGRRGGTENVAGIVGLGEAAEHATHGLEPDTRHMGRLRDMLQHRIIGEIAACQTSGDQDNRLCNTLNVTFDDVEGEAILSHLDRAGIAASTGSACTAGSTEPSHVLKAMNVPARAIRGAIRFSFSRDNTDADVDSVMDVLPGVVARLRSVTAAVPEPAFGSP